MTTFFEHQRTSFKRNYIKNLIALASSDGDLDRSERMLIVKIGLKRGLKEWQIQKIMESASTQEVFIPESLANRMNLLFDLMQIIFADGHVTASEHAFINSILTSFNIKSEFAHPLFELFMAAAPTTEEWTTFVERMIKHHPNEEVLQ